MDIEWPSGATDSKFFVPHLPVRGIENSVIDFDIDNMFQVLYPEKKVHAEKVTERVNKHFLATRQLEKRAFGNKRGDDFQQYNWGLGLSIEMGLMSDQAELLMMMYTRVVDGRMTEKEFDLIIIAHTSFKRIRKSSKRSKWRDLKTSWKIHAAKIKGVPLSISKKHFIKILEVNDVAFDIDMEKLSRDMMGFDYEADYMHSLLMDDPLLRGEVPPPKKTFSYFPHGKKAQNNPDEQVIMDDAHIQAFRKQMEADARNFSKERDQEMALAKEFEERAQKQERIFLRRMQSEAARREAAYIAEDDLSTKVKQIKQERRLEKQKSEQLIREHETAELLRSTRTPPAIERTNSKLLVPQLARSASKTLIRQKSTERKPLTRAATVTVGEGAVASDDSPDTADDAKESSAKKRDMKRLPRSSSVDTFGQAHYANKPSSPGDVIELPPLYDIDDVSLEGGEEEEDEFAAALLAERDMEESHLGSGRPLSAAQQRDSSADSDVGGKASEKISAQNEGGQSEQGREQISSRADEPDSEEAGASARSEKLSKRTPRHDMEVFPESQVESHYAQQSETVSVDEPDTDAVSIRTVSQQDSRSPRLEEGSFYDVGGGEEGVDTHLDESQGDMDSAEGEEDFIFEDTPADERFYEDEMSRAAVDQLARDMEEDLISAMSSVMADSSYDKDSAREVSERERNAMRSREGIEEDVNIATDAVLGIVTEDVVSTIIASVVEEESLYRAEFEELDSVVSIASEFSKYSQVAAPPEKIANRGATPEDTKLELERLERFKNVAERKPSTTSVEPSPVVYAISEQVQQPRYFPDLGDLFNLPHEDFVFNVPKTGSLLRVLIRHDDEGDRNGLFIHGFKSYSRAEEQGLLRVGDEILAVNDVDVQGRQLEAVIDALIDHEDEFVRMVVRRRDGLVNDDLSPRSTVSWNDQSISTESSPRAFVISDKVQQPDVFPEFQELLAYPSQDLLFRVPKSNGQLRVQIRHDDDGEMKGLFVHGFRPFSNAEKQGLLKVGDELVELNGVDVLGEQLETVIAILMESEETDYVDMVIRRRDHLEEILKYAPYFSPRAGGVSPRGEQIGRDGIEAINEMQWDDIAIDNDSSDSGLHLGEGAFSITSSIGSGVSGEIADMQGYDSEVAIPHDSDSGSPRLEEVVDELDVLVPRTDGALRVLIRSIDGLINSGFYVHGFKPMCKAEGILRAGDVILAIDGRDITGLLLKDVAVILDSVKANNVPMRIQRTYVVKSHLP